MTNRLEIAPEVKQDLQEAYPWYEVQQVGLGDEFLDCVDRSVNSILSSPEPYALVHQGYRRALVNRFPYAIFYEKIKKVITVYCVFHTARNPEKWKQRLS
jgi:plasmid stabilization system protein ParE